MMPNKTIATAPHADPGADPELPAHTSASLGLCSCRMCGLVSRLPPADAVPNIWHACPRCGTRLHIRKPDSISRTWALLATAYILYIPANVLPIMDTNSLFDAQRDT